MTPNMRITLLTTAVAALCCLLLGCGTTGHVGVMHDFKGQVQGDNPAAVFRVVKPIDDRYSCEYMHVSHWTSGWPFNDRYEESLDMLGCSAKVWGK